MTTAEVIPPATKPAPKRPLLGVLIALALIFFAASVYVMWPMIQVRRLHSSYQSVQRGMSIDEVKKIMGRDETAGLDLPVEWYEWEHLEWDEVARIKSQIHYQVPTMYMPVTFGFSFDEEGKLVGKHRFD